MAVKILGLYIGSSAAIVMAIREASLDTARACERLANPMGWEREGEYGRGRAEAARDVRKLADELAQELHRPIL